MTLHIIALYPGQIVELEGQPGVRIRKRKEQTWTQVDCDVTSESGTAIARPRYAPAGASPPAMFRIQLECQWEEGQPAPAVGIVIQAKGRSGPADVEQRVLAPIFNNGHKLIFEFESGDVLHVTRAGEIEIRFIAVDRTTGQVGTRTHGRFHSRYMGLAAKCLQHLEGTTDLFPLQPRIPRAWAPIPKGEADLSFGPMPRRNEPADATPEAGA